jgi:hypothetical protein
LFGLNGGAEATLGDSTVSGGPVDEVLFSSPLLGFLPGRIQSFSFSMAGVNSPLPAPAGGFRLAGGTGTYVVPFSGGATGIFSAELVPEPFTILLVGSGLVSLGLLRRRRK